MIEILHPEEQKIFCSVCGIMTLSFGEEGQLDAELVMNDCSHLQFLGTNEGKEIDKNDLYAKHEDSVDDLSFHDYLNKILDDEDKKKKLIHLICRIKGEKVYDETKEVGDIQLRLDDVDMVINKVIGTMKVSTEWEEVPWDYGYDK